MTILLKNLWRKEMAQENQSCVDPCGGLVAQCDYFRRGLEHKICLERQFKKQVAIRSILRYHKEHKHDGAGLCRIAKRNSRWAKSVALQTGIEDAKDAAQDYVEFFCNSKCTFTSDANRKRTLSEIATATVQQTNYEVSTCASFRSRRLSDGIQKQNTTKARAA